MTPLDGASTHGNFSMMVVYMLLSHISLSLFGLDGSCTYKWKPKQQQNTKKMNIYESTEKSLELMYLNNPPKTS